MPERQSLTAFSPGCRTWNWNFWLPSLQSKSLTVKDSHSCDSLVKRQIRR